MSFFDGLKFQETYPSKIGIWHYVHSEESCRSNMMAAAEPPEVPRTTILQIFEITASHVSKSPKRRPNEKPRKTKLRKSKEVVLL
jgi:hypothetical protein